MPFVRPGQGGGADGGSGQERRSRRAFDSFVTSSEIRGTNTWDLTRCAAAFISNEIGRDARELT